MREIKFRARHNETGEWCIGSLNPTGTEINLATFFTNLYARVLDFNTLGECAKDKNGKEIYEGDITKITDPDEDSCCGNEFVYICEVCYGGGDYPTSFTIKNEHFWKTYALLYNERHTREVIGNIYENPELLKGGE